MHSYTAIQCSELYIGEVNSFPTTNVWTKQMVVLIHSLYAQSISLKGLHIMYN